MKKRTNEKPELTIEETQFPTIKGGQLASEIKHTRGVVEYTKSVYPIDDESLQKIGLSVNRNEYQLGWESWDQLKEDDALFLMMEVLDEHGLAIPNANRLEQMSSEIEERIGEMEWAHAERHISELSESHGHKDFFLVALWADKCTEPYEELWLATMAQHAFWVKSDDYAFSFMISQIVQKRNLESHVLRGKKTKESASLGGQETARLRYLTTMKTLEEMRRVKTGRRTIAYAASLAFKNGFGSSPGANIRLWSRYSKK